MTYVAYKNAFSREMQFWSHCFTVVSYQALFRLSVYKIPAVFLSGAKKCVFGRYATLVSQLRIKLFACEIKKSCVFARHAISVPLYQNKAICLRDKNKVVSLYDTRFRFSANWLRREEILLWCMGTSKILCIQSDQRR